MQIYPIIESIDLLKIINQPNLLIFDATNSKTAKVDFENEHIEGAIYVDLDTQLSAPIKDFKNGGRHPLPSLEDFSQTLTNFGVTKDKHIIIYDNNDGSNAAARFWWMLKSVGHEKVQVLNGGLKQAKKHQLPTSSKLKPIEKAKEKYEITHWHMPTKNISDLKNIINHPDYLIIDVRDNDRFEGKVEPIDPVAGHIPSAVNFPFKNHLDENQLFKSKSELREIYQHVFDKYQPENMVVHCGSGVTACHTLLAMAMTGYEMPNLYVGSWSEWCRNG